MNRNSLVRQLVDDAVRPQRHEPRAGHVPRARRHAHGLPRLRGGRRCASTSGATRSSASSRSTRCRVSCSKPQERFAVYPAKHFVTSKDKPGRSRSPAIEEELREETSRLAPLAGAASWRRQRLEERTRYDLEMLRESRLLLGDRELLPPPCRGASAGSTPWTLLDYFPDDWLVFIDESHIAVPQVRGMYFGDIRRKQTLVDFGFRLPSALDNRPLDFAEFEGHLNQVVFVSATAGPLRAGALASSVVEQVIRPTGIVDPVVEVRPDARADRRPPQRGARHACRAPRARPRHDADEEDGRGPDRLPARDGREGPLPPLRDRHPRAGRHPARPAAGRVRRASSASTCCARGSTFPRVSLVCILDADKEGYLRSGGSLDPDDRPRRPPSPDGSVIMYADQIH